MAQNLWSSPWFSDDFRGNRSSYSLKNHLIFKANFRWFPSGALKYFTKLQEKHVLYCLFLWACCLLPRTPPSVLSLKLWEVFQNIFDIEHLIITASKFLVRLFVNLWTQLLRTNWKKKDKNEKNIHILIEFWSSLCGVFKTNWYWVVIWWSWKIWNKSGVKTYICWNRQFRKFLLNKLVRLHFPKIGATFSFSLLREEGRVKLPPPLLRLHCITYKISPNFLVWKFYGNAQFPKVSRELPPTVRVRSTIGRIVKNSVETMRFHKISTPGVTWKNVNFTVVPNFNKFAGFHCFVKQKTFQ